MKITAEFIALIVAVISCCGFLWNKLDQIRKDLGTIREDYVKHSVCAIRRNECIKHIKEIFGKDIDDDDDDKALTPQQKEVK